MVVWGVLWSGSVFAVEQASTYPGCATRNVSVDAGGSARIDLSKCHSFGLGVVARPPAYGTATPGDSEPVDSYVYTHSGNSPADVVSDQFAVLDDNSDLITITVMLKSSAATFTPLPATLASMAAGVAYAQRLSANGGAAPYQFRVSKGALPAGLALERDGLLSGLPTHRGPYDFSVETRDAGGKAVIKAYAGTVLPSSMSLSPTVVTALQGMPFSQPLSVLGGLPPHRFQLEGAGLPPGLELSPSGVISGTTPVLPGRFPVRVRITDSSTGPGAYFELKTLTLDVATNAGGLPAVSIQVSPAAVAEDESTRLVYTVTRGIALPTPTVVNIATSGTAKTRSVATLTIPAGATTASVRIRPLPDQTQEPDETVVLAVAPGAGYVVGSPASASGTIVNDDLP